MPGDPATPTPHAPTHVVAGVLADARGRVLLARRTRGRDLAGLWEFPGGKVEPGETPEAALVRELEEELGIRAQVAEPLIAVPQAMAHKRIVLDVRHVRHWQGQPRGLDGQALLWVPREKLARYAMPPADRPVVAALLQPDRLLVTPSPEGMSDDAWLGALQQALASGIGRVQLRAPGCPAARWQDLLAPAVALCRAQGAEVFIHGDAAQAQRFGTGLHWPESLLMQHTQAPALPLSASCHSAAALARAGQLGCRFALVGTLKPSASHPGRPGIGWQGFARLRETSDLPLYAIGGLDAADMAAARVHGAQGIAAIRAFWPQG